MAIVIKRAITGFKARVKAATTDYLLRKGRRPMDPCDLSRAQKRAYKEKLQRLHAQLRQKLIDMQDGRRKTKGLQNPKSKRRPKLTDQEAALVDAIEFQAGGKLVLGVGATAAAVASAYKISRAVDLVSDTVNSTATNLSSLIKAMEEAVTGFVMNLQKAGGSLWKVALALLVAWILHRLGANPLVTLAVEGLVLGFAPELKAYCFGSSEVHVQSGLSDTASFIAMVCTCWIPGKDVKNMTGEFLKRAGQFPRATEGIESFLKKGLEVMERFINFVLHRTDNNLIRFTADTNAFQVWTSKSIHHLKTIASNPTLQVEELMKIRQHYLLGFGFMRSLLQNSPNANSKHGWRSWL